MDKTLWVDLNIGKDTIINFTDAGLKQEFYTETASIIIGIGNDHTAELVMDKDAWIALNNKEEIHISKSKNDDIIDEPNDYIRLLTNPSRYLTDSATLYSQDNCHIEMFAVNNIYIFNIAIYINSEIRTIQITFDKDNLIKEDVRDIICYKLWTLQELGYPVEEDASKFNRILDITYNMLGIKRPKEDTI